MAMLRNFMGSLLDLMYVPRCCSCDMPGVRGMCASCAVSLHELGPACPRCAEPHDRESSGVAAPCPRCRAQPPPFHAARAAYRYGGELAVALCRLKYGGVRSAARGLASLIAPALGHAARDADVIVPVPLHWRRLAARGFNQAAAVLGHALRALPAAPVPAKVDDRLLRRVRPTLPQSGRGRAERVAGMAGAFAVPRRCRSRVAGARVLLFDDVMTTGATAGACASALLHAGAASVAVFCMARAVP